MAEAVMVEAAPSAPESKAGALPSGQGTISGLPRSGTPTETPKEGSAKAKLFERFASRADGNKPAKPTPEARAPLVAKPKEPQAPPPSTAPKHQSDKPVNQPPAIPKPGDKAPETKPEAKAPEANEADKTKPEAKAKAPEAEPSDDEIAANASDKTKENSQWKPWQLVQRYKKEAKAAREEAERTRSLVADEPTRKLEVERLTKAEQRAKELEDHIRYVDYSKSSEFKEKYEAPYTRAWETAMAELNGVSAVDEATGETRTFAPEDMLELVRMPLAQARALAEEKWGNFADDMMMQRKEIRSLYDKQAQALEDARKNGATREQQAREEAAKVQSEIQKSVKDYWTRHSEAALKDEKNGVYLNEVEGDDELNGALERGTSFVDDALAANPMDPKLTPAQREEAVRKHIALRNRARAFGAMKMRYLRAEAEKKALSEELAQYRASVPNLSGNTPQAPSTTGLKGIARFQERLMRGAK